MVLDPIDIQIIQELQNNVRLSNKQLAAKVKLAPSSCLQRVRKLTNAGIFQGFHVRIDPKFLGSSIQAFVAVQLKRHSQRLVKNFEEHVLAQKEVVAVFHLAGSIDFYIQVAVRDVAHLRDFVLGAITSHPNLSKIETSLLFNSVQKTAFPNYLSRE